MKENSKLRVEILASSGIATGRGLSQKDLATALHVQQPTIARIEKRTDMYISTLRSHIEAMGGELEVIARFPEGTVRISNFAELGEEKSN